MQKQVRIMGIEQEDIDLARRLDKYGGVSCYPVSNYDGFARLSWLLMGCQCEYTVSFNRFGGWKVEVPKPEDRRKE